MPVIITQSPEETLELGRAWGASARSGWILGLSGGLGAGKTLLVQGLAHGLGIKSRVHSPTFALVHEYTGGRLPLFHLDLYRLDNAHQIAQAGLDAYLFEPAGVTAVEWSERWFNTDNGQFSSATVGRYQFRRLFSPDNEITRRRIEYEDIGA